MLRLFILRHAKSSWGSAGVQDIRRPLNERGIGDLPRIAAAMARKQYQPDAIYCSSAKRTQMTLDGLFSDNDSPPPTIFSEMLYTGGMEEYLGILAAHDQAESIMIIGHNPCVHMLANHLVGHGKASQMDDLAIRYPTGALCVIDFDLSDWGSIKNDTGTLVDFICPRSLQD